MEERLTMFCTQSGVRFFLRSQKWGTLEGLQSMVVAGCYEEDTKNAASEYLKANPEKDLPEIWGEICKMEPGERIAEAMMDALREASRAEVTCTCQHNELGCSETDLDYYCCRPKGHEGDHVACGVNTCRKHVWSNAGSSTGPGSLEYLIKLVEEGAEEERVKTAAEMYVAHSPRTGYTKEEMIRLQTIDNAALHAIKVVVDVALRKALSNLSFCLDCLNEEDIWVEGIIQAWYREQENKEAAIREMASEIKKRGLSCSLVDQIKEALRAVGVSEEDIRKCLDNGVEIKQPVFNQHLKEAPAVFYKKSKAPETVYDCPECYGTGFTNGIGAPCKRGCK